MAKTKAFQLEIINTFNKYRVNIKEKQLSS